MNIKRIMFLSYFKHSYISHETLLLVNCSCMSSWPKTSSVRNISLIRYFSNLKYYPYCYWRVHVYPQAFECHARIVTLITVGFIYDGILKFFLTTGAQKIDPFKFRVAKICCAQWVHLLAQNPYNITWISYKISHAI